jgi:hypothetical protein
MSKLSRARSTLYNLIKPDFKKEQVWTLTTKHLAPF